jgi:hypothetical protein
MDSMLSCSQIFNSLADSLSKLALDKQTGRMFFEEILDDSVINSGSFSFSDF